MVFNLILENYWSNRWQAYLLKNVCQELDFRTFPYKHFLEVIDSF